MAAPNVKSHVYEQLERDPVTAEIHERTAAGLLENIAWTYREPLRDALPIAGLVAFFNERVEIEVDGERQPCPPTPWSRPGWWR